MSEKTSIDTEKYPQKSPCQKTLPQTLKIPKKPTIMSENTSTDPEKYKINHHNVRKHIHKP
jgi:hypothetical protein